MRHHPINGWFHASEFLRAATAIHQARGTLTFMNRTVGFSRGKYIEMRIDQRTGDFIILDGRDHLPLTPTEIYSMFPELEADLPALEMAKWMKPSHADADQAAA